MQSGVTGDVRNQRLCRCQTISDTSKLRYAFVKQTIALEKNISARKINIFNICGVFFQALCQAFGGSVCLLGCGGVQHQHQGIHVLILGKRFLVVLVIGAKRQVLREHICGSAIHTQIA